MKSGIAAVMDACATGRPDSRWVTAIGYISDERTLVDERLAEGLRVYGFNTHLGHLDGHERGLVADEQALVRAHLVRSNVSTLTGRTMRLITACKLQQLSKGGSGIHPATYSNLLAALGLPTQSQADGCWASYGAGDVVPAAWWVHWIQSQMPFTLNFPGDAITLLNGSFFSTAIALDAAEQFCRAVGEIMAIISAWSGSSGSLAGMSPEVIVAWERIRVISELSGGERQLPLSLRDWQPVGRALLNSVVRLRDALEARLSAPSCNPMFVRAGDVAHVVSQNSFLDFDLTFAITQAHQALTLGQGVLQRIVTHVLADLQRQADIPEQGLVQPPKIMSAYSAMMQLSVALPMAFAGDDSEGVEDLRDLSLPAATMLRRSLCEISIPSISLAVDSIGRPSAIAECVEAVQGLFLCQSGEEMCGDE